MVELASGLKRRRSETDENERIAMRQMVFNMSICKLNKDLGRKEPSLFRSVIITNTVKYIENEMDEEMIFNFRDDNDFKDSNDEDLHNSFQINNNTDVNRQDLHATSELPVDLDLLNNNNPIETSKFGTIGDRRKIHGADINPDANFESSTFSLDSSLPSIWKGTSTFTFDDEELRNSFSNVDISLYDIGNPAALQSTTDWRVYPTSCAMEFEQRKPDTFFEELDQIMQVLVGM